MNRLYYLPIDETINQVTFNQLLPFVSREKQEQVIQFRFDIDKKLSLYSELLVRTIACQKLGVSNLEIILDKNAHGKPFIKDWSNFHFNISHTRNAVAVAVSDAVVGVDIEKVGNANLQIANRFFTTDEQEYISKVSNKENKQFYEVWTKKKHLSNMSEGDYLYHWIHLMC